MNVEDPVRFVDERLGATSGLRKLMRYVFPDHWSFMLGEIALYAFIVLIGTGIFLAFYYSPSDAETVYRGSYAPLQGLGMTEAYRSTVHLSLDVPGGLLLRQTHHWAANIFIASILFHMVRILFTGAFRKPRELNYLVGVTMLMLAVLEGFAGYSLPDDLLSGMGLVIAYAVALSIPFVGPSLAVLIWDGEYPGGSDFWDRLFTLHILILPLVIATLIGLHLAMIMRQHHTQFPGKRRTEKQLEGTPMWPAYALRSTGLLFLVVGVLFLLGGLIQINPIWEWGPFEVYRSTNGAQPDWYLGWLIGGLREMPPLEIHFGSYTVVPNPFWGGAAFPLVAFGILYVFPLIDRRFFSRKGKSHNLLDRPRDNPRRSAFIVAFLSWVAIPFVAGAVDRVFFRLTIPYTAEVWFFRILSLVGPFIVYAIARRIFEDLRRRDPHPLRGWNGRIVRRTPTGGFETLGATDGRATTTVAEHPEETVAE
ncbi:MAG TPA: cytochrome bc complex cytochrome b subunit [Baekduia sp.]|nr:cytochrome bc complex cytochrome b subunit [Baekduia sp.]